MKQLKFRQDGKFKIMHVTDTHLDYDNIDMSLFLINEACKREKPDIAILCIPAEYAAENADKLVSLGIKGFWNFTQYDLVHRYENIAVENVHLGDSLMTLCYQINEIDKGVEG